MGNDYSRMQGTQFPPGYFCLGFRQPDTIQVLHAAPEVINLVKHAINDQWSKHGGIKSEKRYSLGIELRLAHDPIGLDSNDLEKVATCFKMVASLLQDLLNNGCSLVTAGHFIRGVERNIWILSRNDMPLGGSISKFEVAAIGLEDWNRIFLVNTPIDAFQAMQSDVESLWSLGVSRVNSVNGVTTLELGGQPWDSYKAESEKTPLLVIRMIDVMSQHGFRMLMSTHVRGVIDTLFFVKDPSVASSSPKRMMMGLNQQDQLRFYSSCSEVVNGISKLVKEKWEKGILGDEFASIMWVLRLKGTPWWVADWDKDSAMAARILVSQIIHELRSMGWRVSQTLELYRSQYDKSFFLLEKDTSAAAAVPHFTITSHDIDRLCIADAPEDLQSVIQEEIKAHWTRSLKEDANSVGYLEFSLAGRPWLWDSENCALNLEAMGILCWIIEIIQSRGWELTASADISSNTKYSPHTLVFALKSDDSPAITVKD